MIFLFFLRGYTEIIVRHVYREANSITDRMIFFVINHPKKISWYISENMFVYFKHILLSNFSGCIYFGMVSDSMEKIYKKKWSGGWALMMFMVFRYHWIYCEDV